MDTKKRIYPPYIVLAAIYIFFIVFAVIIDKPSEIVIGLMNIIKSPDILISDYMDVGGIGATFVNVALTSSFCLLILVKNKVKPNGAIIMSMWLVTGFSFLGKNIFNILPLIFGVYLFSKYQKEPFLNYILVALLSTSLAPVVSQFTFSRQLPIIFSLIIGISIGIFLGFILSPIASYTIKVHNGYNLYNIGFASGLIATLLMSVLRYLGINFDTRLKWHTGDDILLFSFIFAIGIFLIVVGLIYGNNNRKNMKLLTRQPGRLIGDFYLLFGETTYINMGILSIIAAVLVIFLGGDLNGATICAIFTVTGFASFGKTIKNVIPVVIGAVIAATLGVSGINEPITILSILFSTCLAPIAGQFGFGWGMIAGAAHVSIVANIGYMHGGLNLYSNGLAGGFVAMILLPLITTFKKEA